MRSLDGRFCFFSWTQSSSATRDTNHDKRFDGQVQYAKVCSIISVFEWPQLYVALMHKLVFLVGSAASNNGRIIGCGQQWSTHDYFLSGRHPQDVHYAFSSIAFFSTVTAQSQGCARLYILYLLIYGNVGTTLGCEIGYRFIHTLHPNVYHP